MLNRRNFLGIGGVGLLALSNGCQPPELLNTVFGDENSPGPSSQLGQLSRIKQSKDRMLGYPINMNTPSQEFFQWREQLAEAGIDRFAFNNVGNPFEASPIAFNTHYFERVVINKFSELFGFAADDAWGFLSHSGTDSNMHGMYMGRTLLKGRTGVSPKAYFTREAHYSVQILRDLLGLEGVMVSTLSDGAIDCEDLANKLAANADAPALVVATVGTTFRGATDDIGSVSELLADRESYLHVDAALFGGYLPFTEYADQVAYRLGGSNSPGRYDSIAVSCHKFFGFPSPAGLFITKQSHFDEFSALFGKIHNPEYIHQVPGTITCSRDAVKPAEFYYFSTPPAVERQVADAKMMLTNATYLFDQLRARFPRLGARRANRLSNTVYFRNPGAEFVKKYSLATMQLNVNGRPENFAHIVVMPHVSRAVLDEFFSQLEKMPGR